MALTWNDEKTIDRIFGNYGTTWSDFVGTTTVFNYFNDAAGVNDAIYFNIYLHKFKGIRVYVGTALVADSISVVWEYYNASDVWTAFSNVTDPSNGFQNAGDHLIIWDMPTDWASNNYVHTGATKYVTRGHAIRCRITAVINISEGGAQSTNTVKNQTYAVWIADGGTYRLSDLYTADQSGGWGVITKDATNKSYLLNANLQISNGQFNIRDHETLTIGKTPNKGEYFTIEMASDGTLQLGEKDGSGQGYNGAVLIWNNGRQYGVYNFWEGEYNCYASFFWMWGGAYLALSFKGPLSVLDSVWSCSQSVPSHVWMPTKPTSGEIKRSLLGCCNFYIYTSALVFDGMHLGRVETGMAPNGVLAGMTEYMLKISNMDFKDNIKAIATQEAALALVDCSNFGDNQAIFTGNYTTPSHIHRKWSFRLKVIDIHNNPVVGAKVMLEDVDGYSGLFEDVKAIHSDAYITDLDTPADTSARVVDTTRYSVEDILRVRGELLKISEILTGTTMTVARNQPGTVLCGVLNYHYSPYKRKDFVTTNTGGGIYYDTDKVFAVTVKDYGRLNGSNTTKNFNPFTLTISKPGYKTYKKVFTMNGAVDEVIKLEHSPYTVIVGIS